MLGKYFRFLRYFAYRQCKGDASRTRAGLDVVGWRIFCFCEQTVFKRDFPLPLLLIIIFSTKEKPKKRNEKECQSRSTEMREVCQGLRWKYSFCGAIAEQKGRFSDATRKGLTFTNDRDEVIFAFHFYFFWR